MIKNKNLYLLLFLLLISLNLLADYRDAYSNFFFDRVPSSRAIALGNSYVAVDGDLDSYFFNPAGLANLDNISLKYTYSSPLYILNEANYNQFSIGFKFYKNFVGSINYNKLNYGNLDIYSEDSFVPTETTNPFNSNLNMTLATSIDNNLSVGAGFNYFTEEFGNSNNSTSFIDIGAIYKYKLKPEHDLTLGLSIKNITFSYIDYGDSIEDLPSILKIGVSDTFTPNLSQQILTITAMSEYQHVLDYEYRRGLNFGLEFGLANMFFLRTGYFSHIIDDYGFSENKGIYEQFTYGIGMQTSLTNYLNLPLKLQVDYANLPPVEYSENSSNYDNMDNFDTLTIKLAWDY